MDTAYVFYFCSHGLSRDERRTVLGDMCFVTRDKFRDKQKVIGISTSAGCPKFQLYEFVYLYAENWGEDEQRKSEIRANTGLMLGVKEFRGTIREYPILLKPEPVHFKGPNENVSTKIARNEQCPCGSGRKYKRCHGR
ncbi:MAG: SEC-C domain-containing protein [bacterium]|nr:SEC-C domain-containing protein [bacterium]